MCNVVARKNHEGSLHLFLARSASRVAAAAIIDCLASIAGTVTEEEKISGLTWLHVF
jgi:hypothetical protein